MQDRLKVVRKSWKVNNNKYILSTDFPHINEDSLVLDVGGYLGNWASDLFSRRMPFINIYEPIPSFSSYIKLRFKTNNKIKVFGYGLYHTSVDKNMFISRDGSSVYYDKNKVESSDLLICKFVNVVDEITSLNKPIDLIKLNCEGSEYNILNELIKSGTIKNIKCIMVQFHRVVNMSYNSKRNNIISELKKLGFKPVFSFPYTWEVFAVDGIKTSKKIKCKL